MTTRTTPRFSDPRFSKVSVLLAALACTGGAAMADTVVPGDVVVPAGGLLLINDNTIYTGTLTIGEGAQVIMGANWQIRVGNGGTMTVNGTEAQPVEFFRQNGEWSGVLFQNGSTANIHHADITGTLRNAIIVEDADVLLDGVWVHDLSETSMSYSGSRYAIEARAGANLTLTNSTIGPFYGRRGANSSSTAGTGGSGLSAYGLYANQSDSLTLTNNTFRLVRGGQGGQGGQGSQGSKGDDAPDQVFFNGQQGDTGGKGGTGGPGGVGGHSYILYIQNSDNMLIAQNVLDVPAGGRGGKGGKGGKGGTGGAGGDGGAGVFGNGGAGGKGGTGGTGGNGGTGGHSGDVYTIRILNPVTEPDIANNSVYAVTGRVGGERGDGGDGGNGGSGGSGGSAGIGGSKGSNGSTGSTGSTGTNGSAGSAGEGRWIYADGQGPSGFVAHANNNIVTFWGPGFTRAYEANTAGIIEADYNIVRVQSGTNFDLSDGPFFGITVDKDPMFANPSLGDFTLQPTSPAIDAGTNSLVPSILTTDFNGDDRFQDDLAVVDTGLGGAPIADLGAFEAPGEVINPCPADTNGDGILDNGDIGVFVQLFLAGDLAADFNGDGILDNGDIGSFVAAFLAGC